jgi:hypothetical protein
VRKADRKPKPKKVKKVAGRKDGPPKDAFANKERRGGGKSKQRRGRSFDDYVDDDD